MTACLCYIDLGGFFLQIIFEAVSGDDQKGDIAIDDVNLVQEPCTVYPPSAAPGTTSLS